MNKNLKAGRILLVRLWEGRHFHTLLVQSFKRNLTVPNKATYVFTFDPTSPLQGIYPAETLTTIERYICTRLFIATLFIIVKYQKQPKCP